MRWHYPPLDINPVIIVITIVIIIIIIIIINLGCLFYIIF